ncbi:uncharacterized protein LOC120273222 [Dioscorea cayenensis subsp. rotundata]|uniref:Uncharacterized protein LOC120273222 n=1 Tax=Dioscorea cayennensis subsp. rotundata TaxID=55577 RepID=A0AB40C7G3_DIOCR|nr:uncharacterized protein LOC120273222 [Dioscorea cayenensis subsp. rotundata]
MSRQEDAGESALAMMGDVARNLHDVDIVILLIIMNGHFHVVVLDNEMQEYMHHTSVVSKEYDRDAGEMRRLFDRCVDMDLDESTTANYPIVHDTNTPRQKRRSVDCAVYIIRFIEQLLDGEKLRVPQADVPYLRLKYVTGILKEGSAAGITDKGDSPTWAKKD